MIPSMSRAQDQLRRLLERHEETRGSCVRVLRNDLFVGRPEPWGGAAGAPEVVIDRVRLTRLVDARYGLSVRRHTGRWERTPFVGSLTEMVDAVLTYMPHLVSRC